MVEFQQVCMAYKEKEVLNNVDLTIQDGEFFVLIGSSGCGKTTLLKSINKLLPVQQGTLKINGTPVSQIKVNQLPNLVGYVVQAGGLFPHLTVEENIALVMKVAQYPKEQIHDRVTAMLKMVNLDPALYRNQYPSQLSGGQQQRVGVARAFAVDPPIVLMDEPFSALDPMTRSELQNEIHALQKKTGKTIIFVTHDMDEAIKLADRICIIQSGHIVQCDTPENIPEASGQSVCQYLHRRKPPVVQPGVHPGRRYHAPAAQDRQPGADGPPSPANDAPGRRGQSAYGG
ncbi:MAG: ATP-binding cassette domain-containing protein [Evtepia gabavorous]